MSLQNHPQQRIINIPDYTLPATLSYSKHPKIASTKIMTKASAAPRRLVCCCRWVHALIVGRWLTLTVIVVSVLWAPSSEAFGVRINKNKNVARKTVIYRSSRSSLPVFHRKQRRIFLLQATNDDKTTNNEEQTPARPPIVVPVVWKYNVETEEWDKHQETESTTTMMPMAPLPVAVQQTWNWCNQFVLPLQLCPWARASLETPQALQIFLVDQKEVLHRPLHKNFNLRNFYYSLVEDVGERFEEFLQQDQEKVKSDSSSGSTASIESAAIFFVVFVEPSSQLSSSSSSSMLKDFGDFYDWFDLLEETWGLLDTVIVAPFHPDWSFEGVPESVQFEKRSPHPTVTLVSARVVDAAGEAATEQIGKHNEQVLLSKTAEELQTLWNQCLEVEVEVEVEPDSAEDDNAEKGTAGEWE